MADQSVEFLIKMVHDGKGAELTVKDLERIEEATKGMSDEASKAIAKYAELQAVVAKAREAVAGHADKNRAEANAPAAVAGHADKNRAEANAPAARPASKEEAKLTEEETAKLALAENYLQQAKVAREQAAAIRQKRNTQNDAHVQAYNDRVPDEDAKSSGALSGLGRFTRFATVAGVAYMAIQKAKQAADEWFASIDKVVRRALDLELVGTTIESVASKTRQAKIHNQDFAQSYSLIKDNVLTVAREISHLTETQSLQVDMAKRVSDAQMSAELARNALNNRFSPIARIEEETRIKLAALQREYDMQVALDKIKKDGFDEEAKRAALRADMYKSHAEASEQNIVGLSRTADKDKADAKIAHKTAAEKVAAMKEELLLVKKIEEGKAGPLDPALYGIKRLLANQDLNPDTEASKELSGALGPREQKAAAAKRSADLVKSIAAAERVPQDADDKARQSEAKLQRETRYRDFAEGKEIELGSEEERAKDDAKQQAETNRIREVERLRVLEAEQNAARDTGTLQQQQSIQPANVGPSGGTASLDAQLMQEQNLLLREIKEALV